MLRYRSILVDDEELARNRLRKLLAQTNAIELVAEAENPFQCMELIQKYKPDLLFLDIQMPGLNGFEMIQQIPSSILPMIIFITAYDRYALKAFESLAIDYLLKPIKLTNLQQSVSKLQSFENTFHKAKQNAASKDLQDNPLINYTKRFVLKYGRKWSIVEEKDVVMFFAKEKFCYLRSNGKNRVIDFTLHELESKLDPAVFVRVHRSSIISRIKIINFKSIGSGRLEVTLSDGTKVQSSRSYLQSLKKILTG